MSNRGRQYLLLLCLFSCSLPPAALACKCQISLSSCNEVAASNVVFVGTVESIEPNFLNRWNLANGVALQSLNEAYLNAQEHPSDVTLARLKDVYLKAFPDLPQDEKNLANAAKTTLGVTSTFTAALSRGVRVRFHVQTLFKYEDDDDDRQPKAKGWDDDDETTTLDVWNPFVDCGVDFQPGETYLVYANTEEGSDYIFTGSCTRTRRLSDAGDDLAYLFFYKNGGKQSARLEGFTTTDAKSQSDFDPLHETGKIKAPVPNAQLELRSDDLARYAQSDGKGKFLFDGLPAGDYRISAFAAGYPMYRKLLADPRLVHVKERSCSFQILLLPADTDK
jgi:Carboxypeptidase regulatory-like domain